MRLWLGFGLLLSAELSAVSAAVNFQPFNKFSSDIVPSSMLLPVTSNHPKGDGDCCWPAPYQMRVVVKGLPFGDS
ncbi:hypothetical protein WISP_95709 [Willisornis vidua]|uniref:Uncharacterized protein n=1 Tax=Willisornis vidua TaxID=1566151 RepID=A0ABQ9D5W1_9PASS|nr:hypothetical protein WISP_95709 [Willisornis vidua]